MDKTISQNQKNTWVQEYLSTGPEGSTPSDVVSALVEEIIQKVSPRIPKDVSDWVVLDVGCGRGNYTYELSKRVKQVVGVEPYEEFYKLAQIQNRSCSNVTLHHAPVEDLNLEQKFDLVISLTTVEHMPKARQSFEKVISWMSPGGVLFLTAPNKYWPIECHYQLPFLSWLPLSLANIYLKLFKSVDSYESCSYSRSYLGMKKLFHGLPCETEFILPDLNKGYVGCGQRNFFSSVLQNLGVFLIQQSSVFWNISKGFMMLVTKKSTN